ncbi:neural cell adhesion molecule 1-like isoform X1 [Rhynchophorus ferrugineus]|uniref:neural cell adhesion molecule 1-like isoform X1 n=1 Tax=Rhynchophorus ferrugineus TaxID=354439 RepID=UPI003FCDAD54
MDTHRTEMILIKTFSVFYVLSLLLDVVSAKLYLSHQSEAKPENEYLTVLCRDIETGEAVSWKGPKSRPLGEKTIPKVSITSHGAQLIFDKLRKQDSGTYTCKSKRESAEFSLSVEDPIETAIENPDHSQIYKTHRIQSSAVPRTKIYTKLPPTSNTFRHTPTPIFTPTAGPITFYDTPEVQQGEELSTIVLRCTASATVTWLVDGEDVKGPKYEIIQDGLVINNLSKEDANKTYICKAVNEASGTWKDRMITLKVVHKPRLPPDTPYRRYMKTEEVYGYYNSWINLTCEVEASPPPTFKWFDNNRRKKIGHEQNDTFYKSILRFQLTKETMGTYKCQASNTHGMLEIIFEVSNGTQPYPPTSMQLKKAEAHSLHLEIEEPDQVDSKMNNTDFRVEYRPYSENETEWEAETFALSEDKTYMLTGLHSRTEYEVRAATVNQAGISEFTNTSIFETLNFAPQISSSYLVHLICVLFNIYVYSSQTNFH